MTCKRAPKTHILSVVSLLITVFCILIALVAPSPASGYRPAIREAFRSVSADAGQHARASAVSRTAAGRPQR